MKPQRLPLRRPVSAIDVRPFRFERRAEGREEVRADAMAAFYDEDGALSLTRVTLIDQSPRGLGLESPVPVEPGVRFSLHARGRALPHTTGIVACCKPTGESYRIGLRCDPKRAA